MEMDKRCVIFAAGPSGFCGLKVTPEDFIICADGGYRVALEAGFHPNAVIGDFDSLPEELIAQAEQEPFFRRVPREKDQTDAFLCLEQGMAMGYRRFLLLGGLGGRLDHTMANLQLLSGGCDKGLEILLEDEANSARMVRDGFLQIPKREGWKLSVFSYSDYCEGVALRGVQYPLEDAVLRSDFPLGISNEFLADMAEIGCRKGTLLIILSKDES